MRVWVRKDYIVREVDFDGDLHKFEIIDNEGFIITTITPDDLEDMKRIISVLDKMEEEQA